MRGKQLVKMLKTIDLLAKPSGTTVQEIQAALEVDRRSVYRILEMLEELGFPIYDEKMEDGAQKRWKLTENYLKKLPNMTLPDIHLTLSEILSLYLLKGNANLLKGTELEKSIESAFGKIAQFLPEDLFKNLNKIKAMVLPSFDYSKDYSGKEAIINTLMEAIIARESCYVTYHSFYDDNIKQFTIDPLHIFEYEGGLYLYVNATRFGEIRTLAVERIQKIDPAGEHYEYPVDFDPEEMIRSVFDIIYEKPIAAKIWFSANQARYVRQRQWAKSQQIEEMADGSIILSMTVSSEYMLLRWLLSQGAEAVLLEPADLRKTLFQKLKEMANKYESDPSSSIKNSGNSGN